MDLVAQPPLGHGPPDPPPPQTPMKTLIVLGDGGNRGTGNLMAHQLVKLYPLQACPRMCLLVEYMKVSVCRDTT